MGKTPSFSAGMFRGVVVKLALCVVLAGLGLAVVRLTGSFLESRESFVNLSVRVPTKEAKPLTKTEEGKKLRFAVAAMVSAEETFSTYRRLVQRISRDVGYQEGFVLRPSYAEVRRELEQGKVDVALVCTGTYVHALSGKRIMLLAQPEFREGLQYRSLFIVPAASRAKSIEDLRGTVMAFTDPESNTGCLVPSFVLTESGYDPKAFFKKVVFTGSHDQSILAVALSVVDGAAVDSLVWESNILHDPSLPRRVRIIWQSEPFGPPPIVIPAGLETKLANSLRDAFLALDKDEEGRNILSALGIERFILPREEDYRSAVEMYERLHARGEVKWP